MNTRQKDLIVERLTDLKKQNEKAKNDKAKKEGSLEEKMKQLRSFGCETVEELDALIRKEELESNELGVSIKKELEDLENYDI
jgi:hypothetical protein